MPFPVHHTLPPLYSFLYFLYFLSFSNSFSFSPKLPFPVLFPPNRLVFLFPYPSIFAILSSEHMTSLISEVWSHHPVLVFLNRFRGSDLWLISLTNRYLALKLVSTRKKQTSRLFLQNLPSFHLKLLIFLWIQSISFTNSIYMYLQT